MNSTTESTHLERRWNLDREALLDGVPVGVSRADLDRIGSDDDPAPHALFLCTPGTNGQFFAAFDEASAAFKVASRIGGDLSRTEFEYTNVDGDLVHCTRTYVTRER